ncbi:hypothetical protein Tco_1445952, partial [Tanacetum coccineum]
MMIDPTMTHKEEIYQVILEIIKNTTFYKAILAYADVPEIYMYQFWFTVTKIKNTDFYEFKLANKKCLVYVEVLRQALDICPRVPEKEFIVPPSEEELLTFLIRLEYKGELIHLPQMFIDHMHQPWRTIASIINKFLSRKTTSNNRLCQSRVAIIWEDVQEYGRAIPDAMSTDAIKQSETYKAFINYSTGLVPPKKTKGKGSQGKKSDVTPKLVSVEVSDESDLELARRRTSSRRITKKKVSISADDNIIPETDVALELAKSMSLADAKEEEAARSVHSTYERLITESDEPSGANRPTGRRSTTGVVIQDTPNVPKKKLVHRFQKLKGIQTLTLEEQLAADTMQAPKANRNSSRRVPDEAKGNFEAKVDHVMDWGSKEKSEYSKEETINEEIKWVSTDEEEEKKDDDDDDRSIDIEKTDDEEETDNEFVQGNEYVQDNMDKEMKDAEVAELGKGEEEITVKEDAENSEKVKDDNKKAKLPPSSSSLSVSS